MAFRLQRAAGGSALKSGDGGLRGVDTSPQTITGTGIPSGESFGAGSLRVTIEGTGISSGEAFGSGTVNVGASVVAQDAFGRSVTNGLGNADIGGAWSLSGSAADFDVDGAKATLLLPTAPVQRSAYLAGVNAQDVEVQADFSTPSTVAGANGWLPGLTLRQNGTTTYYVFRIRVGTASYTRLDVFSVGGDATLSVSNTTAIPVNWSTPGTVIRLRFRATGANPTLLQAKAWRPGVDSEPAWQLTTTDSTGEEHQLPGDVGIYAYSWSGNVANCVTEVDNFSASTPTQTIDGVGIPSAEAMGSGSVTGGGGTLTHASDAFGRTLSNQWGTADVGGAWTLFGTAADFDVTGSAGTQSIPLGAERGAYLAGVSVADVLVAAQFSWDQVTGGTNGIVPGVIARANGVTSYYRARVRIKNNSTAQLDLYSVGGSGSLSQSFTITSSDWTAAGTVVNVKLSATGASPTTLKAKAWKQGDSEPDWQITTTDSQTPLQVAGQVGTVNYYWNGTPDPLLLTVDNFAALGPTTDIQGVGIPSAATFGAGTVTGGTPVSTPRLLHTDAELDYLKAKVATGTGIVYQHWADMLTTSYASLTYVHGADKLASTSPTYSDLINDAAAAYTLALRWRLNPNPTDGQTALTRCIYVLNAWRTTMVGTGGDVRGVDYGIPTGGNGKLTAAWSGINFARAVALIADTPDWEPYADDWNAWAYDIYFGNTTTVTINDLMDHHGGGNWIAALAECRLSLGVVMGNATITSGAVSACWPRIATANIYHSGDAHQLLGSGYPVAPTYPYALYDSSNEMGKYWMFNSDTYTSWQTDLVDGFLHEIGRDIGHCSMALAPLVAFVRIARLHGLGDLANTGPNMAARLRKGIEIAAGYYHEAIDDAWTNRSGSLYGGTGSTDGSNWRPSGGAGYGGTPDWAAKHYGTWYGGAKDATASFQIGGYSADHAWHLAKAELVDHQGWTMPETVEVAGLVEGTGARDDTGPAGVGVLRVANHMVWPALLFQLEGGPQTIAGQGIASAGAFGQGTVTGGAQTITGTGIVSGEAFGSGRVDLRIAGQGIASGEAMGTGSVSLTIAGQGIATGEAVGTGTVNLQVQGSGITTGEAFGAGTVSLQVLGAGISSAEAFGTGIIVAGQNITGTGITTGEAFGSGVVNNPGPGNQSITGTGIVSGESFGLGSLNLQIAGQGITSSETFGSGSVSLTVAGQGIASGESFGSGTVSAGILGQGIPSGEAFGLGQLNLQVLGAGITSSETFGSGTVTNPGPGNQTITGTGIDSGEAFGAGTVNLGSPPNQNITGTGIPGAEAFGVGTIMLLIAGVAIASAEAMGSGSITVGAPPPRRIRRRGRRPDLSRTSHPPGTST